MRFNGKNIELSKDNNGNFDNGKNSFIHENITYILKPLSDEYENSKGGNSSVFLLFEGEEDEEPRVIKICNTPKPDSKSPRYQRTRFGRFITEIEALNIAKENNLKHVINIEFNGILPIKNTDFVFYVMERADSDLTEFIHSSTEIDVQDKIKFCADIFNALKNLDDIKYYHRDIKPDNILLFNKNGDSEKINWKIGDLGLARHRDRDFDLVGERIGPFGWISQEAMNKYLTEKKNLGFDCSIDTKSDIFQLGKIYWFVFMKNCPIGQLYYNDFSCEIQHKRRIWKLIIQMLSSSKDKRPNIEKIEEHINKLKVCFNI